MASTRIAFLLGAGVSIPANMPSTENLTNTITSRIDDFILHTDKHFYKTAHTPEQNEHRKRREQIAKLIALISTDCTRYFSSHKHNGRVTNYEDIYYATIQLVDHLSQEYENPAIQHFAGHILNQLSLSSSTDLLSIATFACTFIRDAIEAELSYSEANSNHLDCMLSAVTDELFGGCDIFTLNHDLLIDRAFEHRSIEVVDGFGVPDGVLSDWEPHTFESEARCYYLKLHGSINWHKYRNRRACVSRCSAQDPVHADNRMGERQDYSYYDTAVLLGTFNKVRDYYRQPYFTLIHILRRQLARCRGVFVSGYSFGDKGINTILSEWLRDANDRKLILLHENGDGCIAKARGAIRDGWGRYKSDRVVKHSQFLANCNWVDLREYISE